MADSFLEIVVWNVEYGSAIYINTPNGRSIILDAGASQNFSPASWLKSRYQVVQAEWFILSHADTDHLTDIEQVHRLLSPRVFTRNTSAPRELIYPTYPPTINPLKYYLMFDNLYSSNVPTDSPYSSSQPQNWGNVTIHSFCNSGSRYKFTKLNDYSVATFILFGNFEFLFPGDLEAPGWQALLQENEFVKLATPNPRNQSEIRFLVAAHHGHKAGVYKPFLDLYQPHLVLISGKYGDPHTDYDSYVTAAQGYPVYEGGSPNTRFALSTKVNNYILIRANSVGPTVSI